MSPAIDPLSRLTFTRGAAMRNRLAPAPLTNLQSDDDGCISDDELAWLASFARGIDFVLLGRGAILHHDFPALMAADLDFRSASLPVSRAHLAREGRGDHFIDYRATWQGFVAEQQEQT